MSYHRLPLIMHVPGYHVVVDVTVINIVSLNTNILQEIINIHVDDYSIKGAVKLANIFYI